MNVDDESFPGWMTRAKPDISVNNGRHRCQRRLLAVAVPPPEPTICWQCRSSSPQLSAPQLRLKIIFAMRLEPTITQFPTARYKRDGLRSTYRFPIGCRAHLALREPSVVTEIAVLRQIGVSDGVMVTRNGNEHAA